MKIIENEELEQFKKEYFKELEKSLDEIDERYELNKKTISQTDLQASILLEMRKARKEKLAELDRKAEENYKANMTSQQIFEEIAHGLYTKTPEFKESDNYRTTQTDRTIKAFYK